MFGNKTLGVNEHRICRLLSYTFGFLALALVLVYGSKAVFEDINVVGESFVNEELPAPDFRILGFPLYAKPITWFSFFGFLYWAFGLETWRGRFLNMKPFYRRLLFPVVSLVAFGSLYEILFNFGLWVALMATYSMLGILNPDILVNIFNVPQPINLVFATKIIFLIFGLSTYSLYFLIRVDKEATEVHREAIIAPYSARGKKR